MNIYDRTFKTKDQIYDNNNAPDKNYHELCSPWVSTKVESKREANFNRCLCAQFFVPRDPSIKGDTPFKKCLSPIIIFCQEVANGPKTYELNRITGILHYYTWRNIENFVLHKNDSVGSNVDRPSQAFSLNFFIMFSICMYMNYTCSTFSFEKF